MAEGIVKWFNDSKGYGFISRNLGDDVFVHHTAIVMQGYRTLQEGQHVSFDITREKKGLRATNVCVLSTPPAHLSKIERLLNVYPISDTAVFRPEPDAARHKLVQTPAEPLEKAFTPTQKSSKPAQKSPRPVYVDEITPLMRAVQKNDLQRVCALLAEGSNPNAQERRGLTALMFAVAQGKIDIIKALLEAGANPNITAASGDTVFDVAYNRKQERFLNMLYQASQRHEVFRFNPANKPNIDIKEGQQKLTLGDAADNFYPDRWESSTGLAYMRRDGGQFGSFPLHDDYSDEGSAEERRFYDD